MAEPALLPVLLRMAGALAIVLALLLACAWLARRGGWLKRASDSRVLRPIEQLSLGPRSRISVVQVQDTWLVLGVSAGQISVLHRLPAALAQAADRAGPLASPVSSSVSSPVSARNGRPLAVAS